MVTYRIKTGQGAGNLFTRVGMQLEAYCSGIGKMLLAHLPEEQQRAYLAGGPFPALTAKTITQPEALAQELERIRAQGFALDGVWQYRIDHGWVASNRPLDSALTAN